MTNLTISIETDQPVSNDRLNILAKQLMMLFRHEKREGKIVVATINGEDIFSRPLDGNPNTFVP